MADHGRYAPGAGGYHGPVRLRPERRPLADRREVAAALAEKGIEIAGVVPRRLTPALAAGAQWLITMGCGDECPVVPGAKVEDWPLEDPAGRSPERVRAIRDEIERRVCALIDARGWGRGPDPAVRSRA